MCELSCLGSALKFRSYLLHEMLLTTLCRCLSTSHLNGSNPSSLPEARRPLRPRQKCLPAQPCRIHQRRPINNLRSLSLRSHRATTNHPFRLPLLATMFPCRTREQRIRLFRLGSPRMGRTFLLTMPMELRSTPIPSGTAGSRSSTCLMRTKSRERQSNWFRSSSRDRYWWRPMPTNR